MTPHASEKQLRDPAKCKYLQRVHLIFVEVLNGFGRIVGFNGFCSLMSAGTILFPVVNFWSVVEFSVSYHLLQLLSYSAVTLMTCFTFYHLQSYVWMTNYAGQRVLDLTAQYPSTKNTRNEVLISIEQNFNFVRSWCEVPMYCLSFQHLFSWAGGHWRTNSGCAK